jgi:prefoldin subunit 5
MISKYQFMEVNTQRRATGLREKIPDIKKTLEMVKFLRIRRDNNSAALETNFELNDTLYARATVDPADTEEVYLWLGANVMLAYPVAEAESMLTDKLATAETSLAHCDEDLEFLREQITVWPFSSFLFFLSGWFMWDFADWCLQTMEVATARVYNWDVVQRRKDKAEGKGDEDEGTGKGGLGG